METQTLEKILLLLIEANKASSFLNAMGIYMLIGIAIADTIGLFMLWRIFWETKSIKSKLEE